MRRRRKSEETVEEGLDVPVNDFPVSGPYDADALPADDGERVDLGSLLILHEHGKELRLQVDEASGTVQSVVLATNDGAVELRAFAAPRHGDLWGEARPQIASDISSRGGTATERDGRWGPELVCRVQVQTPEGRPATQESRIIGINGPRWMLRATLLGKPAGDLDGAGDWEDVISRVAVQRGQGAMMSGEALPLTMPPTAKRVDG